MHDDDPDFRYVVSLMAELERHASRHVNADVLPLLGMARAELTDFGQQRMNGYLAVDVADVPSALTELRARLTAVLSSTSAPQHRLRIEATLHILSRASTPTWTA